MYSLQLGEYHNFALLDSQSAPVVTLTMRPVNAIPIIRHAW